MIIRSRTQGQWTWNIVVNRSDPVSGVWYQIWCLSLIVQKLWLKLELYTNNDDDNNKNNDNNNECPALAQNQYKKYDTVARAVHWNLCKKYQMPCNNKWYEHQPQPVTENESAKLFWNYSIWTDRVIPPHRPDLTLVDKTKNKVSLINVVVPWDSRVEQKEQEKKR